MKGKWEAHIVAATIKLLNEEFEKKKKQHIGCVGMRTLRVVRTQNVCVDVENNVAHIE